jgi:hypothetical protein
MNPKSVAVNADRSACDKQIVYGAGKEASIRDFIVVAYGRAASPDMVRGVRKGDTRRGIVLVHVKAGSGNAI